MLKSAQEVCQAQDCSNVAWVGALQRGLPRAPRPNPAEALKRHRSSIVAKIQFAAYWVRFDTSYAAARLVRFCASAGPSHRAALTHPSLMGHLVHPISSAQPQARIPPRRRGCGQRWAAWMVLPILMGGTARRGGGRPGLVAPSRSRYIPAPPRLRSQMQKTVSLSTAEATFATPSQHQSLLLLGRWPRSRPSRSRTSVPPYLLVDMTGWLTAVFADKAGPRASNGQITSRGGPGGGGGVCQPTTFIK